MNKKFYLLPMVSLVAVLAGCNQSTSTGTAGTDTNAPQTNSTLQNVTDSATNALEKAKDATTNAWQNVKDGTVVAWEDTKAKF